MKTQIELLVPSFSGFYGSIWEEAEGEYDAIQNLEYDFDNGKDLAKFKLLEEWGFDPDYRNNVAKLFADTYANIVSENIGIDVENVGFELNSPREYNFTTDKIYVKVEVDYDELVNKAIQLSKEEQYYSEMAELIKKNHTSCSGFWSWMSNDIEEWYALMNEPGYEHYTSYFVGYLLRLMDDRIEALDDDMYEYVNCNTDWRNIRPNSENAKEEYALYEKCRNVYIDFAETHELPNYFVSDNEWENYVELFMEYVEKNDLEMRTRKILLADQPEIPNLFAV